MTNAHAYGFLVFGSLLNFLPLAAPSQFPPNGIDGANTSALWLQLMGWVNGVIGAFYLIRLDVVPFVGRLLAWRPEPLPELLPEQIVLPTFVVPTRRLDGDDGERQMAA